MTETTGHSRSKVGRDAGIAAALALLTVGLIAAMAASPDFLAWAFARHHNVASWYIRPLFLVPFALFAWRRSLAGIALTLLLLATSMFWFPEPATTDPMVADFLRVELEYLTSPWTIEKVAAGALVPLTLGALAVALWRRNLVAGLGVVVLIAALKVTWSVLEAGAAGFAVVAPALAGLAVCVGLIWFGVRRTRRRDS